MQRNNSEDSCKIEEDMIKEGMKAYTGRRHNTTVCSSISKFRFFNKKESGCVCVFTYFIL